MSVSPLSRICPTCAARPGTKCFSLCGSGAERQSEPHPARVALAVGAGRDVKTWRLTRRAAPIVLRRLDGSSETVAAATLRRRSGNREA